MQAVIKLKKVNDNRYRYEYHYTKPDPVVSLKEYRQDLKDGKWRRVK